MPAGEGSCSRRHALDGDGDLGLRRDIGAQLGCPAASPPGALRALRSRRKTVGQDDRSRRHLIGLGCRRAVLRDLVDRGGHAERRGQRERPPGRVASMCSSSGCQSDVYFTSNRLTVMLNGAPILRRRRDHPRRPLLARAARVRLPPAYLTGKVKIRHRLRGGRAGGAGGA